MAGAPAHHRENGFANVNPAYEPASGWTRFTFFVSRMWSATFSPRRANFPVIASDLPAIRDNRRMPGVPPTRFVYLGPEGTFAEQALRTIPAADRGTPIGRHRDM